jgi:hypothetical protein
MTVYVCESFNISIQYTCKYPNYSYNYQVWVAYKESSWIYAVFWVILLICFGRLVYYSKILLFGVLNYFYDRGSISIVQFV